ncbi:MAG: zf-HC2 domain-containing protein [Candidatus Omnitrophica bacterium]|nr:zf-HC2 domain-containing protein [Candidatus Omnitrophota bacterium]
MPDRIEKLIKAAYKKWKDGLPPSDAKLHPGEEEMACFFEGKLPPEDNERIKAHLINCEACAEVFAIQLKLKPISEKEAPKDLVEFAKTLVPPKDSLSVIEIAVKLGQKALEILNTTGDVLVGQEFVPAPVLRSRQIKEFKDEVTILKDLKDIRVEVKIENKHGQAFDLIIFIKDKQTHHIIKDLRVTLLKEDLELESYLTVSDKVIFEHVLAGKYIIEVSGVENRVASILLDIKR